MESRPASAEMIYVYGMLAAVFGAPKADKL